MAETVKNFKAGVNKIKEMGKDLDLSKGLSFFKALTEDKNSKLSNVTAGLMVVVAVIIDVGQLVFAIFDGGYLSGPIALALQISIFSLWFFINGVSYWGKRKAVSKVIAIVVEEIGGLIPYVNALWPATTVMVVAAVAMTRIEEAGIAPSAKQQPNMSDNTKNLGPNKQNPEIKNPVRVPPAPAEPKEVRAVRKTS